MTPDPLTSTSTTNGSGPTPTSKVSVPVDLESLRTSSTPWKDFLGQQLDNLSEEQIRAVSAMLQDALAAAAPYATVSQKPNAFSAVSARSLPDSPHVKDFATRLGSALAALGWTGVQGGGPNGMKHFRDGAIAVDPSLAFSVCVALGFEPLDPLVQALPHTVVCKDILVRQALMLNSTYAVVVNIGGYGTVQEAWNAITGVQTGLLKPIPIVLYAPQGDDSWQPLKDQMRKCIANKTASPEDMDLIREVHSLEGAISEIDDFYANCQGFVNLSDETVLIPPLRSSGAKKANAMLASVIAPVTMESLEILNHQCGKYLVRGTQFTRVSTNAVNGLGRGPERIGFYLQPQFANRLSQIQREINRLPNVRKTHKDLGINEEGRIGDVLRFMADPKPFLNTAEARELYAENPRSGPSNHTRFEFAPSDAERPTFAAQPPRAVQAVTKSRTLSLPVLALHRNQNANP